MNPNSSQPAREDIEVRITALLLGELPPAEAELLRWTIAQDAELAKVHDRLQRTLGLVREVVANPDDAAAKTSATLRLSEERRQKLLAHFKTVKPPEFVRAPNQARRNIYRWLAVAAVLMLSAVLVAMLLPALAAAKRKAQMVNSLGGTYAELDQMETLSAPARRPVPAASAAATPAAKDNAAPVAMPPPAPVNIVLPMADSGITVSGALSTDGGGGNGGVYAFNSAGNADANKLGINQQTGVANYDTLSVGGNRSSNMIGGGGGGAGGGGFAGKPDNSTVNLAWSGPVPAGTLEGGDKLSSPQVAPANGPVAYSAKLGNLDTPPPTEFAPSQAPGELAVSGATTFNRLRLPDVSLAANSSSAPYVAQAANNGQSALNYKNLDQAGGGNDVLQRLMELRKQEVEKERVLPAHTDALAAGSSFQSRAGGNANIALPESIIVATAATVPASIPPGAASPLGQFPSETPAAPARRIIVNPTRANSSALQSREAMNNTAPAPIAGQPATGVPGLSDIPVTGNLFASADRQPQQKTAAGEDLAIQTKSVAAPVPQPEVATKDNAFSTFSLNVSDVSFKLAAASLEHGVSPSADSIRSEEFINAFDYRDPEPPAGAPVGFAWERAGDAFAHNRDFLRFDVKTAAQGRAAGRPLNLVLLLDKSGSMERADRVAIIREALRVLATQLEPHDTLSVVTFARTARLYVDGVPGSQAGAVFGRLSRITPEGGTNLEEAMKLAYQTALRHFLSGGVNRVVLMTDGAANLGSVDAQQFKDRVETNRKQGIALDCFGIGWEDYNDNLLELLASHGDGRYGFLNTPEEATTGFATQLAGALQVAAADVKVQVEFNPDRVTAYRQIGYASHQLTKQQFRDNTVDAAVLGAAESGNGLYTVQINPQGDGPVATVRVRFRVPGTSQVQEHSWLVPYTGIAVALDQASPAMRLAATAATFAEWLADSPYAAGVTPDQLLRYLSGVPAVYGTDPRPQKLEWMIRQAKSTQGNGSSGASPPRQGGF